MAISTFHSLGVRMLRSHGERLGLKPNFSILDSDDVLGVLKDAGGTTDNALARRWQWAIGGWKNRGLDAAGALADVAAGGVSGDERSAADALVAARVMERYQERLAAYQAVDFDDLIVLPTKLLAGNAEVREAWREQLRYVLVDEYQDTNGCQYELMKLLAGPTPRFTAVGDDDQSIYGWRGATVENLKRLPADYPRLKVIPLEQNYRSTGNILSAANAVIGHNPKLFEKKLWSALGDGDAVAVVESDDETHEAERALARIESLRGSSGAQLRDSSGERQPTGQGVREGVAQAGPVQCRAGRLLERRAATLLLAGAARRRRRPAFCGRDEPEARMATRRWHRSAPSPDLEDEPVEACSPSRWDRSAAAVDRRAARVRRTGDELEHRGARRPAPKQRRRSCSAG